MWMAGYAARTKPSEGAAQELYAKALALEDQNGRRAVLVTADLLGFPRSLSARIGERLRHEYELPRESVLLNASHTHGGPVVRETLRVAYDLSAEQWGAVTVYSQQLENKVVAVVGTALENLAPARLAFGHSRATFAVNRRVPRDARIVSGANPDGPVDHDVPVLRIDGVSDRLRAVVFGYACHNTTVGADTYQFHGDYAGWAQQSLESRHPGTIAFFVAGCGADANPYPRGSVELARQYGETLAGAVDEALRDGLATIAGPLKCAFEEFAVAFAPAPTREELEARLKSDNIYERRHAQEMLNVLERDGRLPERYPYALQVWRFGSDLTLIAMAGEVVVDYVLRFKKELGREKLWVAGYSNDVFAYIPSLRILREGGYEGGGAMIYYVQPGPFAESIEETIVAKAHELVRKVNE